MRSILVSCDLVENGYFVFEILRIDAIHVQQVRLDDSQFVLIILRACCL